MTEKESSGVKWLPLILIIFISAGLWQLTPPSGLSAPAWHPAIIFVAIIASIVAKVLPIGVVSTIGITVSALAYAAGDKTASGATTTTLSELNGSLIWLIATALMIARGSIKAGLGRHIALQTIRLPGKCALELAYGLAFADLIPSPAMSSNTARCGGVIHPTAGSLACSLRSNPEDESRSKIGTFLITCIGNANDAIAALFMTGYAGNLLTVRLVTNAGVTLTWGGWFMAALLPCPVSLLLVPLLIYWIARPEIEHTPDALNLARKELAEIGSMSRGEWLMLATVGVLLVLWIFGDTLGVDATTTSFMGLFILLLSGVLSWEDVKSEKGAWDTLIWSAALLMMANQLKKLGSTTWFGNLIDDGSSSTIHGTSWVIVLLLLNAAHFYTHYFFASGNAQIAAPYVILLGVGLYLNIPATPTTLTLVFTSSLYCSLTQYTHAHGPILLGTRYVPMSVWWRIGFIISLFNQAVFITVGLMWWEVLSLY